jgi:hypothetical protein
MFCAQCLRQIPWFMPIRRVIADRGRPRRQRRGRSSCRQNHVVRHHRRPVRELNGEWLSLAAASNVPNLAENTPQPNMSRRRALGQQQHLLQVIAVQSARQEILAIGVWRIVLRKAQELQWIS